MDNLMIVMCFVALVAAITDGKSTERRRRHENSMRLFSRDSQYKPESNIQSRMDFASSSLGKDMSPYVRSYYHHRPRYTPSKMLPSEILSYAMSSSSESFSRSEEDASHSYHVKGTDTKYQQDNSGGNSKYASPKIRGYFKPDAQSNNDECTNMEMKSAAVDYLYAVCVNGKWFKMPCAPGTKYDDANKRCSKGDNIPNGTHEEKVGQNSDRKTGIKHAGVNYQNLNDQRKQKRFQTTKGIDQKKGNNDFSKRANEYINKLYSGKNSVKYYDDMSAAEYTAMLNQMIVLAGISNGKSNCLLGSTLEFADDKSRYMQCVYDRSSGTTFVIRYCGSGTLYNSSTKNCGTHDQTFVASLHKKTGANKRGNKSSYTSDDNTIENDAVDGGKRNDKKVVGYRSMALTRSSSEYGFPSGYTPTHDTGLNGGHGTSSETDSKDRLVPDKRLHPEYRVSSGMRPNSDVYKIYRSSSEKMPNNGDRTNKNVVHASGSPQTGSHGGYAINSHDEPIHSSLKSNAKGMTSSAKVNKPSKSYIIIPQKKSRFMTTRHGQNKDVRIVTPNGESIRLSLSLIGHK